MSPIRAGVVFALFLPSMNFERVEGRSFLRRLVKHTETGPIRAFWGGKPCKLHMACCPAYGFCLGPPISMGLRRKNWRLEKLTRPLLECERYVRILRRYEHGRLITEMASRTSKLDKTHTRVHNFRASVGVLTGSDLPIEVSFSIALVYSECALVEGGRPGENTKNKRAARLVIDMKKRFYPSTRAKT